MRNAWRVPPQSDLTKWRLECERGRQTWHYSDDVTRPQSFFERYCLGLTPRQPRRSADSVAEALKRGCEFYFQLQAADGHWPGDYGGPLFLLPGLLIVCHVCHIPLSRQEKREMVRYLRNSQGADGGWGLHSRDKSTMFGTVLNYVSLRILGIPASDSGASRARELLRSWGGAVSVPSWGKFWLCVLGVYSWDGMNSILPELWVLPTALPVHPSKMWCHCRQVYLPMGYCYARRITNPDSDPLVGSLRCELYLQPYHLIFWPSHRSNVCDRDIFTPHHPALSLLLRILNRYEPVRAGWARELAVSEILRQVRADDRFSNFISIGPISKMIQTLVAWHAEGAESDSFRSHVSRVRDYLWLGTDGLKMQGTNGSQLWDAALAVQALLTASRAVGEWSEALRGCIARAHSWLRDTQIQDSPPNCAEFYRQASKGAFPFSTEECGWIVSDCTAEGLKALLLIESLPELGALPAGATPPGRLCDCADTLLGMQNGDGGYASYEKKRGGAFLEMLNPSEVFGDIMIDYSYTECTSAVLQALTAFSARFPEYRAKELERSLAGMERYIRAQQRSDGSWEGSWGVCFTYGAWFGVEGLVSMGHSYSDPAVVNACRFLLEQQRTDGGWGEDFESCTQRRYIPHETGQVVNTSWALLTLLAAQCPEQDAIERGVKFLMDRQLADGDWPEEDIKGVFNKSCAIVYTSYKNIFPLWALARWELSRKKN